jgi:hypothetical protein
MKQDRQTTAAPSRPEHHQEALCALEVAAEAAELFSRIEVLAADMCRGIGIPEADTVIGATQELARRRARRQLAGVIRESGLLETVEARLKVLFARVDSA